MQTPTSEQLDALIAQWRRDADGYPVDQPGALHAATAVRLCADELAACLAAPPPEPQAMPPIAVGDVVLWRGEVPVLVEEETQAQHCRTNPDLFSALYKPVWTREPRR